MSEVNHISVLLQEAIEGLNVKHDGIYVDCTLGGGGHSQEIIKKLTTGHLYCFDQDDYALKRGEETLSKTGKTNYTLIKANFSQIKEELEKLGVSKVDGILYDLGVSSFQFDMGERGFSYNIDAPLDMRMDQSQSLTAYEIVNTYPLGSLVHMFYTYGEMREGYLVAKKIIEEREKKPIETTLELVSIIKKALPASILRKHAHPAKKIFQALRIRVNNELGALEESLAKSLNMLNKDGRIVVISFHSLEDRIVKNMFKEKIEEHKLNINAPVLASVEESDYKLITRSVITPTKEELQRNNRAHSAKMRIIEKIK